MLSSKTAVRSFQGGGVITTLLLSGGVSQLYGDSWSVPGQQLVADLCRLRSMLMGAIHVGKPMATRATRRATSRSHRCLVAISGPRFCFIPTKVAYTCELRIE